MARPTRTYRTRGDYVTNMEQIHKIESRLENLWDCGVFPSTKIVIKLLG